MKVNLVWKGTTMDATPYAYTPSGSGGTITYTPIPSTGIPANSMAIVFLNNTTENSPLKVNCPAGVNVAVTAENMVVHGTTIGSLMGSRRAFLRSSTTFIRMAARSRTSRARRLLLPVTAWDTNYVATTMSEDPSSFARHVDFVWR